MMKLLAIIALMTLAGLTAAKADETGLATIHAWQAEKGGRICMSSHFHDGSGTGKTKKEAEAAAESSWASFTIFEYGATWGSYALAASQRMDCSLAGGGQWSCATTARPCKKHRSAKTKSAGR